MFEHDYKRYPELTNTELQTLSLTTPHEQITEDFSATVVKVHDGDTIRLRTDFRDFDFPLRFLGIDSPEMNEGGEVARDWLRNRILDKNVQIMITANNRVDKYGRLLGKVFYCGTDVGQEEIYLGLAVPFAARTEGELPDMNKELNLRKWF